MIEQNSAYNRRGADYWEKPVCLCITTSFLCCFENHAALKFMKSIHEIAANGYSCR